MSDHFVYQHKAGGGLGLSDPFWPYVSGGLGNVTFLTIITDWETGDIELRWYTHDPALGWSLLTHRLLWTTGYTEGVWDFDQPIAVPVEVEDEVWSVKVNDWLWTQGAAVSVWEINESDTRWHIDEAQSGWSADNAVSSWVIGEAR